jgi:dihydroorotase
MVNLKKSTSVEKSDLFYRCGWSPFEGHIFPSTIERTFVNGNIIVEQGKQVSEITGSRLEFVRD